MKIALDARSMRKIGGGISVYIFQIVKYLLNNTNYSIVLFCTKNFTYEDTALGNEFESRVIIENLNPDGMGPSQISYNTDINVIPKLLKKYDIDLFHACANWGNSSREINIPVILTVHDVIPFFVREGVFASDEMFSLYEKLIQTSVENATKIITISEFSKNTIIDKLDINQDKIVVIFNGMEEGVNGEDYKGKGMKLLNRLDLIEEKYFIYVGGFYERKNVLRMGQAFKQCCEKHPEYKLVVTGDGHSGDYVKGRFAMFEKEVEEVKEQVCHPGFVPREDLYTLIANSRALLYPSVSEGFGIPIIEAMCLGVPALTADNTVMPEVGKDAAIYFDPFDVDEIKKSMIQVIEDDELRNKKIQLGNERSKQFSWQDTCKKVHAEYKNLLNCEG